MKASFAAAVLAVLAASPLAADAQGRWSLIPSLIVTEEYDDNIFGVANRKTSDFITRFTPGLGLRYESVPLKLLASYAIDAEIFADNSSLNNVGDRQRALLDVQYLPERRLTLGLTGRYDRTETSSDFILLSTAVSGLPTTAGVDTGRRTAEIWSVSPSARYQIDPQTTGTAAYELLKTEVRGGGGSSDTLHQGTLGASRQVTALDIGSVKYIIRHFDNDAPEVESVTSHAFLLGWERRLLENVTASVEAGPRFDDGDVGAEVLAKIDYRYSQGSVVLAYARTESLVVGRFGAASAETVSGTVTYKPLRELTLGVTGLYARLTASGTSPTGDETSYGASVSAAYQFTDWATARLSYRFTQTEGSVDTIRRNVVWLVLEFTYPVFLN